MHEQSNVMTSIKEQVYVEKLRQLKSQLEMILNKTHPDYIQGKALIEQELENRLFCNEISLALKQKRIEVDYESTLAAIQKDFDERKIEMKEVLLNELEERKRQIEHEYLTMDLNEGSDIKQAPKRNLRRRFNDPTSTNDKKSRKTSPTVNTLLSDAEIDEDLSKILANGQKSYGQSTASISSSASSSYVSPTLSNVGAGSPLSIDNCSPSKRQNFADEKREKSVESFTDEQKASRDGSKSSKILATAAEQVYQMNGKLFCKKKCFAKGQSVVLTNPDSSKVNAVIQTVGVKEVGFRLIGDGNKRMNVSIVHMQQGKYTLKNRTS